MPREFDYMFKFVIVGRSAVGKSSLMLRFSDDQFNEVYVNTIGVDFRFKSIDIESKKVKLQIWDTAGQEKFRTITNAYYKGAQSIVIVYDVTSKNSFDEIEDYWLNEVENYADRGCEILLIGNKCDLSSEREVQYAEGAALAERKNMTFFECSAKSGDNVGQAFVDMSKKLIKKKRERRRNRKKDLGTTQIHMDSILEDEAEDEESEHLESEKGQALTFKEKLQQKKEEMQSNCC